MKKIFILFSFLLSAWGFAQNPDIKRTNHWYFGNKVGLDFSSGTPTPITNSAMTAEEGCASISDTCGNLLFYTDGDTVWNKNNLPMPNGKGLMGCWSSTQNSLIIPQPGNDSLYYIFLTDCAENLGANGLRYSIVNINLNGGLGDVLQKNILVYAPAMEKLAATYHANGNDIWIVGLNRATFTDTTVKYKSYLLTQTGLNITPVMSLSNIYFQKVEDGYMRFSHGGNKIATIFHSIKDTIQLSDFNNLTGLVSNPIIIADSTDIGSYGLVFSPDDSKLYCTRFKTDSSIVIQYDLSTGVTSSINNSRTIIKSDSWFTHFFGALQIGSGDGKIYIGAATVNDSLMDIIQNPNMQGLSCNYTSDVINLKFPQIGVGLPNFVDSYLSGLWQAPCPNDVEENDIDKNNILVFPNPFNDYTTVKIKDENFKNSDLTLYDISGRIILKSEITTPLFEIKRNNLNAGIYFLNIKINNKNHVQKLIITN